MRSYLIVANQTLAGEHILEEMRRLIEEGPCSFHVVVPATPASDQWVYTEGEATAVASERLEAGMDRLRAVDADVTGEVGDENPLDAIRDAFLERDYDGIILSTLPVGISRWIGMDLPSRVERTFDVPVHHVVGEPSRIGVE